MGEDVTTDHATIRSWVESRDGRPAKSAAGLAFDFETPEPGLIEIAWDEFFEIFEAEKLALEIHAAKTGEKPYRFVGRTNLSRP